MADLNGRMFLKRPAEHVKLTHPYTDHDFIKSKTLLQK